MQPLKEFHPRLPAKQMRQTDHREIDDDKNLDGQLECHWTQTGLRKKS
jgi:hypothetical protein